VFRIFSNVQNLFRIFSEFWAIFRIFRHFSEFLAQRLVYSESLDFVVIRPIVLKFTTIIVYLYIYLYFSNWQCIAHIQRSYK
jgi:hypothetical protein